MPTKIQIDVDNKHCHYETPNIEAQEENRMTPEQIARVCHEVNKAYCQAIGDNSQPTWDMAPQWQRDSAINGVMAHINNPTAGPQYSHEAWLKEKIESGWKWGPEKNGDKKEHPCMVPFVELPTEQQAKDFIFRAIVLALSGYTDA